jgi:hypothetical protein
MALFEKPPTTAAKTTAIAAQTRSTRRAAADAVDSTLKKVDIDAVAAVS